MHHGHWFGLGGGFMWLFWVLLIVVIVWAVKAVVGSRGNPPDRKKSALDILEERYATGEIDQDEFERKRKHLGG